MNSNIDKVNMSLDDIIKLEKKQKRMQHHTNNRNQGGNSRAPNKGRQQFAKPRGGPRPQNNTQQPQRKPFGLLNKSKAITKKSFPNNPRARRAGPANVNAVARAAASTLKGRLSGRGVGQQQQQLGKMQNLARIRRRRNNANPPANRAFNRFGNGANGRQPNNSSLKFQNQPQAQQQQARIAPANKLARKQIVQQKQPPMRRQVGLTKAKTNLVKAKIAMQTARKNVQKAKRLLTTRKGPIQQIMTPRYAKNLAAKKPKQRVALAKKAKLIVKNNQPRSNSGLIRVNVPNNRKPVQSQSTKPIIKRSRPAQRQAPAAGKGGNRMVFY